MTSVLAQNAPTPAFATQTATRSLQLGTLS
nr:MAG TPA: hypothetical protein [Herelleviridae sp.]